MTPLSKKGEKLRYLFLTSGKMDVCFGFFKRRLWYLQSPRVTRLKHSRVEMSLLNLAFTKRMKNMQFSEKSKSRNCIDSSNSVQFAIAAENGMERFALSCMVRYFL